MPFLKSILKLSLTLPKIPYAVTLTSLIALL